MTRKLQKEVDTIADRRVKAKLNLITSRCKTAFFSLDSAESKWQANIVVSRAKMCCNPDPTFVGVTYDRQQSSGEHVNTLPTHVEKNKPATTFFRHIFGLAQSRSPSSEQPNAGKPGRMYDPYLISMVASHKCRKTWMSTTRSNPCHNQSSTLWPTTTTSY